MQITRLYHDLCPTPIGDLTAVTTETHLCALAFLAIEALRQRLPDPWAQVPWQHQPNPLGICDRIQSYFAGEASAFATVPLLTVGTPFQEQVWDALTHIEVGQTITYGALAHRLGQPTASRAVGAAVGRNRIAIAIPCHRVVGGQGQLTGYAWGLERKRWLLAHEGHTPQPIQLELQEHGCPRQ